MDNERNPRDDSDEVGRAPDDEITGIADEEFEDEDADEEDEEVDDDSGELEGR